MTEILRTDINVRREETAQHSIRAFMEPFVSPDSYRASPCKGVSAVAGTDVSDVSSEAEEGWLEKEQMGTSSWPKAIIDNIAKLSILSKTLSKTTFDQIVDFALEHKDVDAKVYGDFLRFLELSQEPRTKPELYLAPNGMLVAEWYKSSRSHLDVEFAGNDECYFGLFAPRKTIEGAGSVSDLTSILSRHSSRPMKW